MTYNLHAIMLWSRRSRDADKIVGFFSREMGRLTARAASAARATAKFAALTEPFVESEIAFYMKPGQAWGKLVGGRMLRSFPNLRTDLERSTAASWVCEVVHRLTAEEQPGPDKFQLLMETLEALETTKQFSAVRLAFAVRFLDLAGFGLHNRDPWITLKQKHPLWAESLMETPVCKVGDFVWEDPAIKAIEHLAGEVVSDHLAHPLYVNRFRQMTGVEI